MPDFAIDRNILWREALTTDIGGVWDITVVRIHIANFTFRRETSP